MLKIFVVNCENLRDNENLSTQNLHPFGATIGVTTFSRQISSHLSHFPEPEKIVFKTPEFASLA